MKPTDRADVPAAPIQLEPVAWVSARRQVPQDDHWGQERALIN